MPASPRKAPFHCPHCGFVQHEPPHLVSTYCRSCGSHYKVAVAAPSPKRQEGLIGRTLRTLTERPPREITCHHCRHTHEVSGHAKSTICPGCNVAIQLEDISFTSHASRPVNTRGVLTVESGASLTCARIVCGEAVIRGKINGDLYCEGTLRLIGQEKFASAVQARKLQVDKNAKVDFLQPVQAGEILVQGQARGDFNCGTVRITKRGILEGRITARSVVVDRGGILRAESAVRPERLEAELPTHEPQTPLGPNKSLPSLLTEPEPLFPREEETV